MSSDLTIERSELDGGAALLQATGAIDSHTYETLSQVIDECFQADQYRLILDMAGVDFLSSAGVGVIIGSMDNARRKAGDLVLLKATERVREVFEILGMLNVLTFADDMESAMSKV